MSLCQKQWRRAVVAVLLLIPVLSNGLAIPPEDILNIGHPINKRSTCTFSSYTSLGDSYSAGIKSSVQLLTCKNGNTANCTTKECMKNTGAYGYQFSQLYPPKNFQFLACSGADTTTCLANQVPLIPNNTDLITITIGGNNNDAFATVVKDCVYTITGHDCDDALKNGADTIANIAAPMATLYKAIRTAAPAARVVVLGYVQFWPAIDNEDNCQSHFLKNPDATQKTTMNTLVANMNLALKGVVSSFPGFSFVDVSPYFEGNRLCDAVETPWIQYELIDLVDRDVGHLQKRALYNEGIFHPTLEGQNVYKNALVKELAC